MTLQMRLKAVCKTDWSLLGKGSSCLYVLHMSHKNALSRGQPATSTFFEMHNSSGSVCQSSPRNRGEGAGSQKCLRVGKHRCVLCKRGSVTQIKVSHTNPALGAFPHFVSNQICSVSVNMFFFYPISRATKPSLIKKVNVHIRASRILLMAHNEVRAEMSYLRRYDT